MDTALELPGLTAVRFGRSGKFFPVVDSTNQRLLEWASEGAPHGASILALAQTEGRGRQGRSWESEAGCGLYASLLLRPESTLVGTAAFSLVTALTVAETLRATAAIECTLKWPNDVCLQGKKLAGILLEARGGSQPVVVVGLGLNLKPPAGGWPPTLRARAIALSETTVRMPSERGLWAQVLNRLEQKWELFRAKGFSAFQEEWDARDRLRGEDVRVQSGQHRFTCRVEGVDSEGRLRARVEDGSVLRLEAGEVHLENGGEE